MASRFRFALAGLYPQMSSGSKPIDLAPPTPASHSEAISSCPFFYSNARIERAEFRD
jgi:hypothetical protein